MAEEKKSRVASAMSGGKKKPAAKSKSKHKVKKMHVTRVKPSGYNVEHEYEPGQDGSQMPNDIHHVPTPDDLAEHMAQNMPPDDEQAEGQQPQAPPQAAPPSPMPMG